LGALLIIAADGIVPFNLAILVPKYFILVG
jgi:hypothetical protein